jgi:hypothetical protein
MWDEGALGDEAHRFGAYLLGFNPPGSSVRLYVAAMHALDLAIPDVDRNLLAFINRHGWSIGFVDAGLAFRRPSSVIRTKLLTMSAILEVTPELANVFLPAFQPRPYAGYAAFVAIRAACKAAVGTLLVAWI